MGDFGQNERHFVQQETGSEILAEISDTIPRARFRLSMGGWFGACVLVLLALLALFGPLLVPYGENDLPFPDAYAEFQAPQPGAWLGTDVQDRDVLSRLAYGASRTIGISILSTSIAYAIGVTLGIASAVLGGWFDMVLGRLNDALLSMPGIMLGLVGVATFGSSISVLIILTGVVYSTVVYRLARAIGMEIMVADYVKVAQVRGEGLWWIIRREVMPNAVMPLLSDFGLRLIYVVLFISSLSFLGLGVQPPASDWGSMVRENLGAIRRGNSLMPILAPALCIGLMTVSINLIVDDISVFVGGKNSDRM